MINYYPNGCPECKGEVLYNSNEHFYKCSECGCFVTAHREDTEYCIEGSPTGRLMNQGDYELKKKLESLFNFIWKERSLFQDEKGTKLTAPINIIYKPFMRMVTVAGEDKYGIGSDITKDGFLKMWLIDEEKHGLFLHSEIKPVNVRTKAYIWLAGELNITINECRLGYFDKETLLKAIKICEEYGEYARNQIAYNSEA